MRGYHLNLSPSQFLILFLVLCLSLSLQTLGDDSCSSAYCGQGTCVPLDDDYNCVCNQGWTKVIPPQNESSCVFPNCTIDLTCGKSELPPVLLPNMTLGACFLIWCGDGTCVVNGTTQHICECNDGSANLLNLPDLPCFKKCSLGIDCSGLLLSATTPTNGSQKLWKSCINCVVSLSTIILAWMICE